MVKCPTIFCPGAMILGLQVRLMFSFFFRPFYFCHSVHCGWQSSRGTTRTIQTQNHHHYQQPLSLCQNAHSSRRPQTCNYKVASFFACEMKYFVFLDCFDAHRGRHRGRSEKDCRARRGHKSSATWSQNFTNGLTRLYRDHGQPGPHRGGQCLPQGPFWREKIGY